MEFFSALENVRVDVDRKHAITRGTDTLYPVYIILYAHNSLVAKSIRRVTNEPYSHASISFDTSMQNIFTFGNKMVKISELEYKRKIGTGRESFLAKDAMWTYPKETPYEIYTVFITKENIVRMKKRVHEIFDNPEKYRFNIAGLIRYYLGLASESNSKMFCSQFVASLLAIGAVDLERLPSMYSPYELKDIRNVIFVERDILKNYNRKKFDAHMDEICKEYSEQINMDAE